MAREGHAPVVAVLAPGMNKADEAFCAPKGFGTLAP
jgi:hypothetical protein